MLSSDDIRTRYLGFFRARGHTIIPGGSLIPPDRTVLFTSAGIQPLVPYFAGTPPPAGRRLADYQRCLRTSDIDEVGDPGHLTCFEMLGNWSLGDYYKRESLAWPATACARPTPTRATCCAGCCGGRCARAASRASRTSCCGRWGRP